MGPAFTRLKREISERAPVFPEGDTKGAVTSGNEALHAQVWELGGTKTRIAVTPQRNEQTCRGLRER